jgi:hypothetical protein
MRRRAGAKLSNVIARAAPQAYENGVLGVELRIPHSEFRNPH